MFWIRRNTLEAKLAKVMGFEYCTLFDTARSAIKVHGMLSIPSNICPVLGALFPEAERIPVDAATGLTDTSFQLYGYRLEAPTTAELDPLMTGFLRKPIADYSIISFGPKKMLDAGGGGALLSNEKFKGKAYFPEGLRQHVEWKLEAFEAEVRWRRHLIDEWDRYLGDSCIRIPLEQVMPWRVMRRIPDKRDEVVKAIRAAGHPVGTNYPPLPGVTDEGAIRWGREVINFFPDSDAKAISEIVKRTLAQ